MPRLFSRSSKSTQPGNRPQPAATPLRKWFAWGATSLVVGISVLFQAHFADADPVEAPASELQGTASHIQPKAKWAAVQDDVLDPIFPMDEALRKALARRQHTTASNTLASIDQTQLEGHQIADLAFVQAWSLIRSNTPKKAEKLIPAMRKSDHVPHDYLQLTIGEALLHAGQLTNAIAELGKIDPDSVVAPRGLLLTAQAHNELGARSKADAVFQQLASREDPSGGNELALMAMAERAGLTSPRAYDALRRLWTHYPTTDEGKRSVAPLQTLAAADTTLAPTPEHIALRAEALMSAGLFKSATSLIDAKAGLFKTPNPTSCIAWYTLGRSLYKRNQVTRAATVLIPAGTQCVGIDDDRGAKAFYLAGKSLERKKLWGKAASAYAQIPSLYPNHSMGDDGYALAGIGHQESGDLDAAIRLWETQVAQYPQGDLAAEGFWRLAWGSYQGKDTAKAIEWAEKMIETVPVEADPVHALAARYWAGRWRLHADYDNPTVRNTDPTEVQRGLDMLETLCREHPTSFYAILAANRLAELAPERLDKLRRPVIEGQPNVWHLRPEFVENPATQRAFALARLGLVSEAIAELGTLAQPAITPAEFAFTQSLAVTKNSIQAHDRLHKYLLHHPPYTLGIDRHRILLQAFPEQYWDLIQKAVRPDTFDPRIFLALVREESSFNPDIVSWAGARGLSQLMPATAKYVAKQMGRPITNKLMFDPATNLAIGAHYMASLSKRYDGNMFLAVAAYNAGEGNVGKWLTRTGNRPTDEWVESIPFRETRGYVKRVLGTYQTYRVLYGVPNSAHNANGIQQVPAKSDKENNKLANEDPLGPLFPDWQTTNHRVKSQSK